MIWFLVSQFFTLILTLFRLGRTSETDKDLDKKKSTFKLSTFLFILFLPLLIPILVAIELFHAVGTDAVRKAGIRTALNVNLHLLPVTVIVSHVLAV